MAAVPPGNQYSRLSDGFGYVMDERRAEEVLARLASAVGDAAFLWRGEDLSGSDVDIVLMPGAKETAVEALRAASLAPSARPDGRVIWSSPDGAVRVDLTPAEAWPAYYPPLERVAARLCRSGLPLAAASPEDRLLVLGPDALTGRGLAKIAVRATELLSRPGLPDVLAARSRELGLEPIGALIADPERLAHITRRGRLPYHHALAAARCEAGRAALAARVGGRVHGLMRVRLPALRRSRPILISLSGMDGAGKSTAAAAAREALEEAGRPATVAWARLGREELRDRIAGPFKRLLGYSGSIADPVASSPAAERPPDAEGTAPPRVIAAAWVPIVAAVAAYSHRSAARARRRGLSVVC